MSTTDDAVPTGKTAAERPLRKVAGATLIGSSMEWYDFFLYATASALVFNKVFFTSSDPATGTLLSLGTFGVGFLARPVGSVIFGSIGDRLGRKPSLVATLMLMGLSTTMIGLLPDYGAIGVWAPVLLVVLRLLQGLGAGAEHAGATVFAAEFAPDRRRGLFGAIPSAGMYVGVLLSSSVFALFAALPEAAFLAWGWRIPFLISIVLVGIGLFIRLRIDETPDFKEIEEHAETTASPLLTTFREQWRSVLVVVGLVAGPFTATYAYQTYSLSYLSQYLGDKGSTGTTALTAAAVVAIVVVPLAGALSDRIGRRPVIVLGALFSAAFAFPFFGLLGTGPLGATVAMVGGVGVGVPLMLGAQGALLAELFRARNRFTGFSVSREIGSVLFAGMTPLVAAVLVTAAGGSSWPVSAYVIAACVITLATTLTISETRPTGHSRGVPARSLSGT